MRQFIAGSESEFTRLAERCQGACIVFGGQVMPPGSNPERARIGFEGTAGGGVQLLVDRGINYSGPSDDVQRWMAAGLRQFRSMDEAKVWIRSVLGPCYTVSPLQSSPDAAVPRVEASELTDLEEVVKLVEAAAPTVAHVDPDALGAMLATRVRGQDAALRSLSHGVFRHLSQPHPRRPATFFAVGPSGVGKTSTAEALPWALREACDEMRYTYLRLDMTEYQERHRVSQLVGAPQGYIGYGDGAQLLDHIAAHPRCVVLFDEIEKAHPDVLTFLMNAIDAGRISRPHGGTAGHEIDCRHAIFLITSNLESDDILKEMKDRRMPESSATVNEICRRGLQRGGVRPEILGRIGTFLVFTPLGEAAKAEVITLSIQRVATQYGVTVAQITPDVVAAIHSQLALGDFGARPAEQLADEILGPVFATAGPAFGRRPVLLTGRPFAITAIDDACPAG